LDFYSFLVGWYNAFLNIFPPQLQWVVTLLIVIGLVGAFVSLVRNNWIALVVVVILLPFLIPIFQHFVTDIYHFFLYLLQTLKLTAPAAPSPAS
jgi:hypothetical protein